MSWRTTQQADRDIADIYAYGQQVFGTLQADRYQDRLFDTFDLLADYPLIARERTEFVQPIRLHPSGAHLIVYVLADSGILIVRVLLARQDWQRWLSDKR